jgi:RNA polymerase sigma factor (sigma-70 family)
MDQTPAGVSREEAASDELLLASYREASPEGRRAAADRLFSRYYERVGRWCFRFTGERESAADLAQDVFLKAHRSLDSFQGTSQFGTWLYSIARNESINRSKRSAVPITDSEEALIQVPTLEPDPEELAAQGSEARRLRLPHQDSRRNGANRVHTALWRRRTAGCDHPAAEARQQQRGEGLHRQCQAKALPCSREDVHPGRALVSDSCPQWQEELASKPDCIDLIRLGEELSAIEREHVEACPRCQTELRLFQGFHADSASPEELREGQWIAAELQRRLSPSASESPSIESRSNVRAFTSRRRTFQSFALAAAAVIVIVIGSSYWMDNREPAIGTGPTGNVYRTSRFEVVAPIGDLPEAPHDLRWLAVNGATSYSVQIVEVDRTVLWSSETPNTSITLPVEVVARFEPGKSLVWQVTARRGSEVLATSGTQSVRVSVKQPRKITP